MVIAVFFVPMETILAHPSKMEAKAIVEINK